MTRRRGPPRELRLRAETRLQEKLRAGDAPAPQHEPLRLLHELQVHQVELEMQNEELQAARQELESVLRRHREIFDFAPIGYFVLAPAGTIRELNLAGARLLGAERQRLVGQALSGYVAESQGVDFRQFLADVLGAEAGTDGSSCDLRLVGEGAEPRRVRLTASPLHGDPPLVLCAVQDVTAQRYAEEALHDAARNKDAFLAALSHELRNPLAPIRNSLFVLARAEAGGEQARKAEAIIDRQVGHLTRIIDDLLDVTRIARGKIRLQPERLELGDLVRRTMDDHRESFEAGGIRLEARFGSEMFWIDADATRLVQVIGNLLGNAVKFTPRGGRVEVFLRREGGNVALSVRDTGVGIAPEMRARLFEPFSQAPQAMDRPGGGLGLGLAMVKGLAELHRGTVDLVSEGLGRGAEFTLRLPLASAPAAAVRPEVAAERRPQRVLVIEDNLDAAESLCAALELDGHLVQVAHDGPGGLALVREFRPDIVLCDIGLPGMDGYAVARALRQDAGVPRLNLVALSGYALPEDVQRSLEAGFDRHVAKPLALEKLVQLFGELRRPASSV